MPAPYGLTTEGFNPMTLQEVRDFINQRIWDTISPTIDLSDGSLEGQLVGIVAERLAIGWELGEVLSGALDPDKAIDSLLDAICLITGTFRRGAYASAVELTLTGEASTSVPTGSAARVPSGVRFDTVTDALLEEIDAWLTGTMYAVDDRVTNVGNAYVCITAGVSGTGPETEDGDITDGSVHWKFLGEGVAATDVLARATATGPLTANAGTINEIATPVGGWTGVVNLLDATPGRNQMTNEALRVLRKIQLARGGSGSVPALEANLIALKDANGGDAVIAVTVFYNNTDTTDVDGMPPHSVEALVHSIFPIPDGFDQSVFDALLANVGAGIRTTGTTIGTATDSKGREHTMQFSHPEEIPIYIGITATVDAALYPADGDDQIKAAVVAWGDAQKTGKNAVATAISAQAFLVPGVLDVTACLISIAPTPTLSTTIPISLRQLATYDTSRISVTSIAGVP